MDKIPTETLIHITSFLSMKDVLTCIKVSQKWNKIISNSKLYSRLDFDDTGRRGQDHFEKAISFFSRNNRKHIAKNVQHLSMKSIRMGSRAALSLPTLFPNVNRLVWIENQADNVLSWIPKQELCQVLINWRNLSYIYDNTINLNISTRLLESCSLISLRHLQITFGERMNEKETPTELHNRLQALLSSIKNAPLLENISINNVPMSLLDLEQLHDSCSRLKVVELVYIYLLNNGGQRRPNDVTNPTNHVKSFTLLCHNDSDRDQQERFDHLFCNWISYIGRKLPNLETLEIDCTREPTLKEALKNHIVHMISRLPNITTFTSSMYLYLPPRTVLQAFDDSGVKLKSLGFDFTEEQQLQQEIDHIQSSSCAQSLQQLHLHATWRGKTVVEMDLGRLKNFSGLTHLKLGLETSSLGFTISVLQQLPMLEVYDIQYIDILIPNDQDVQSLLDNTPLINCQRLKDLRVQMQCSANDDTELSPLEQAQQANRILQFLLDSCPVLTRFVLLGDMTDYYWDERESLSGWNLSFVNHARIKEVHVFFTTCCHYFTLNNGNAKYIDYNDDGYLTYDPSEFADNVEFINEDEFTYDDPSEFGDFYETFSTTGDPFYINIDYNDQATTSVILSVHSIPDESVYLYA